MNKENSKKVVLAYSGGLDTSIIPWLKETSVAGYVTIVDLTRAGNLIRNNTHDALNPLRLRSCRCGSGHVRYLPGSQRQPHCKIEALCL